MSRWPTAACRSCSAVIIWARTAAGSRMPVDLEPAEGGTVLLSGSRVRPTATVVSPGQAAAAAAAGQELRKSHFATCPRADRHRRDIDDRRRHSAARFSAPAQGDLFGSETT